VKGDPRITIRKRDDEELSPELAAQERLEHENKMLRQRVRYLEGAL
jgi:hypothetical protein